MKRPLAIKIWTVIWLATFVFQCWTAFGVVNPGPFSGGQWLIFAVSSAVQLGLTFALWRMSRIPVVVYFLGSTYNLVIGFFKEPSWHDRYPLLGPFVLIILMAIFALTILPHWKKMTWRPLGRHDFGSPKGAH